MRRLFLAIPLMLPLTLVPAQAAADDFVVKRELLDRRTAVLGPAQPREGGSQQLRSRIADEGGAVSHHLLLSHSYRAIGWHRWDKAEVPGFGPVTARALDRRVGECSRVSFMGCDHFEDVEVALPEALLRELGDKGLRIRFSGRDNSDLEVAIPADQIAAQLAAVAKLRR